MKDPTLSMRLRQRFQPQNKVISRSLSMINIKKKLWLELDYYQDIKIKCSEDAIMLQKFMKMERIF